MVLSIPWHLKMPKLVILLGAPNVGKSALFNRLSQGGSALVGHLPGLTRDVQEAPLFSGVKILDSQGFEHVTIQSSFLKSCLNRAALLLFVVDGQKGLSSFDKNWLQSLRKMGRTIWILINKSEKSIREEIISEIHTIGFHHIFSVSALTGMGCGDLLEEIQTYIVTQDQPVVPPLYLMRWYPLWKKRRF